MFETVGSRQNFCCAGTGKAFIEPRRGAMKDFSVEVAKRIDALINGRERPIFVMKIEKEITQL